jgi:hypothetical protein
MANETHGVLCDQAEWIVPFLPIFSLCSVVLWCKQSNGFDGSSHVSVFLVPREHSTSGPKTVGWSARMSTCQVPVGPTSVFPPSGVQLYCVGRYGKQLRKYSDIFKSKRISNYLYFE